MKMHNFLATICVSSFKYSSQLGCKRFFPELSHSRLIFLLYFTHSFLIFAVRGVTCSPLRIHFIVCVTGVALIDGVKRTSSSDLDGTSS